MCIYVDCLCVHTTMPVGPSALSPCSWNSTCVQASRQASKQGHIQTCECTIVGLGRVMCIIFINVRQCHILHCCSNVGCVHVMWWCGVRGCLLAYPLQLEPRQQVPHANHKLAVRLDDAGWLEVHHQCTKTNTQNESDESDERCSVHSSCCTV